MHGMCTALRPKYFMTSAVALLILCNAAVAAEDQSMICKAAISKIMGRDPKIMKIVKTDQGVTHISYIRANDKTKWAYRCKLEGNRVMWASEGGRWRDDARDEKLTFEKSADGKVISIIEDFGDGSKDKKSFQASRLR